MLRGTFIFEGVVETQADAENVVSELLHRLQGVRELSNPRVCISDVRRPPRKPFSGTHINERLREF